MAIPEEQLTTWAQIGADTTSRDTYATIKLALDSNDAAYHEKNYEIFLQGSYGNSTNIRKESDVDVVIRLDSIFTYDITLLPQRDQDAFKATHPNATYRVKDFQKDVLEVLYHRFGDDVELGTKAVIIKPRSARRKTDLLIATQHRKYSRFTAVDNAVQLTGISFLKSDGTRVVNYPKEHCENLVAKNQATNDWFKHVIRIFKNARQELIAQGLIDEGAAPSYYIEGLVYNVLNDKFGKSYVDSMVNVINWLYQADRSKFLSPNGQYKLLDGNADVTWNTKDCDGFLTGLVELWKGW